MFPTGFASISRDFASHFLCQGNARLLIEILSHSADACALALVWVGHARPRTWRPFRATLKNRHVISITEIASEASRK